MVKELLEKLQREPSIMQREHMIVDAFMDGIITVGEYRSLIETSANNTYLSSLKQEPNKPECDCGSKHTSFSNHHYHWCSVRAWEKGK